MNLLTFSFSMSIAENYQLSGAFRMFLIFHTDTPEAQASDIQNTHTPDHSQTHSPKISYLVSSPVFQYSLWLDCHK